MPERQPETADGSGYIPPPQTVSRLASLHEVLMGESDRGCLLVLLSDIDDKVEELLRITLEQYGCVRDAHWLLDAKAGSRPLGNLAVRTRLAKCLGLISPAIAHVIDEFRAIRNSHAHGTEAFALAEKDILPVKSAWDPESWKVVEERRHTIKTKGSDTARELFVAMLLITYELQHCCERSRQYQISLADFIKAMDENEEPSVQGETTP